MWDGSMKTDAAAKVGKGQIIPALQAPRSWDFIPWAMGSHWKLGSSCPDTSPCRPSRYTHSACTGRTGAVASPTCFLLFETTGKVKGR